MGKEKGVLKIGTCDCCGERAIVSEMKLVTGRVIRLCSRCLHSSASEIKNYKKSLEGN